MPYDPDPFVDDVTEVHAAHLNKMGAGIRDATALAETTQGLGGDLAGNLPNATVQWGHGFASGPLASRPSLTILDHVQWYLATDEDGGTPYFWNGVAWLRAGRPVGGDTIRPSQSPYNCKGDAVYLTDGAISLASPNVLTNLSATYTSADVGKAIIVEHAGAGASQLARATNGSNQLVLAWLTFVITGATGGTFTLTFNAQTTGPLVYNASAATVQAALEGLSTIGEGNVTVTLSGTTYTVTLQAGAASGDPTLFSATAAGLTGTANGAAPTISVRNQRWSYGDVGKRVQVPGAGAGGGILDAYIGSVEPVNSNIAYLVDASGVAVNAATTGSFTYYTRNWLRTTISGFTDAHTVTLAAGLDAGVQANLSGLQVYYGTDDHAGLSQALTDMVATGKPIDLGSRSYITTAGFTSSAAGATISMFGAGAMIYAIPTDNEAESGSLTLGGSSDTTAGRARRVDLDGFSWVVPAAHYRGSDPTTNPAPLGVTAKVSTGGIKIKAANNVMCRKVGVRNAYGINLNFQACRYGLVIGCAVVDAWADSFNLNNSNSTWDSPLYGDFSWVGCYAQNGGDDLFAINHRNMAGAGRPRNLLWVGCRANGSRQLSLGRGFHVEGEDVGVHGCESYQTSDCALDLTGLKATNSRADATVSTPGTGAQIDFPAAPNNVAAGAAGASTTTQIRVFNGTTGQWWIGDVTAITNAGKTLTLTARADMAATCPFTGGPFFAQWGLISDGARFGQGGVIGASVAGFIGDTACLNTPKDATNSGLLRLHGGESSGEPVAHIRVQGIIARNSLQNGIILNNGTTNNATDRTVAELVRDVTIDGYTVDGTGYSTLTGTKPWAGIYVLTAQDVVARGGLVKDTYDQAVLIPPTAKLAGRIMFDTIEGRDIGRNYGTGAPLAAAFDLGSQTTWTAHLERLYLTNPSGTSGGTKYVASYVASQPPSGSTVRGVNSNITGQALVNEAGSGYVAIISPHIYRGKGSPEGVVTAPVGAVYERNDGGTGTSFYVKESGSGNTGWVAYSPTGSAGLPLGLTGATAATRYVGGTASGPPTSGTFAVGDFVVDQSGVVWVCITAGTPGKWRVPGTRPIRSGAWPALGTAKSTVAMSSATVNKIYATPVPRDAWGMTAVAYGINQTIAPVTAGGKATAVTLRFALATDVIGLPALLIIPGSEATIDAFTGAPTGGLPSGAVSIVIPAFAWLLFVCQPSGGDGTLSTYPTYDSNSGQVESLGNTGANPPTGFTASYSESGQTTTGTMVGAVLPGTTSAGTVSPRAMVKVG